VAHSGLVRGSSPHSRPPPWPVIVIAACLGIEHVFDRVVVMLQQSLDDLGIPLAEVTFVVLDLETTGSAAATCAITEVGAVKVRRGEMLGTFQTLVDPGEPVPAFIRLLTGISDEMLVEAPPIETVLPSLLEFLRDSVIVAHNARFDVGFLNAALTRAGYEPLTNAIVDTAHLARKVLAGEVRNHKLSTLVAHLRCPHVPTHRAYADAIATTDVLHHLIERVAGYGVVTLEDLLAISRSRLDGTFAKVALARDLPRGIGVYRFLGGRGNTLYVGKATDLRSRVRSYFYGDPRRKIRDLLHETQSIATEPYPSMLEAEIAEAQAISRETPPYNRVGKSQPGWYVRVVIRSKTPKVSTARACKPDGSLYLGPFPARTAKLLVDAFRDALALHRCARPERCSGCAFGEMSTCVGMDATSHRREVALLATALSAEPRRILNPLAERMLRLSAQERFEEAAEVRDRGALLERTVHRHLEAQTLVDAGEVVLIGGGRAFLLREGTLAAATDCRSKDDAEVLAYLLRRDVAASGIARGNGEAQREAAIINSWLKRTADVRILHALRPWAHPVGARPPSMFRPVQSEAETSIKRSKERRAAPESMASAAI
jgi:DNA polymerase III subunit epsilon